MRHNRTRKRTREQVGFKFMEALRIVRPEAAEQVEAARRKTLTTDTEPEDRRQ